jgi:hypothetical protein
VAGEMNFAPTNMMTSLRAAIAFYDIKAKRPVGRFAYLVDVEFL